MLVQFAQLGVAYAQTACGIAEPRVGLLTIGAEPGKGNKLARRAHELLEADPPHGGLPISFAGNVEGGDLLTGTGRRDRHRRLHRQRGAEDAGGHGRLRRAGSCARRSAGSRTARLGALLQRRGLRELSERLDTETYGGAALLGLEAHRGDRARRGRGPGRRRRLPAGRRPGQRPDHRARSGNGSARRARHFLRRPDRYPIGRARAGPIS